MPDEKPQKRIYLYLASRGGRQRFTLGTFEDLKAAGTELKPGILLPFYTDDTDEAGNRDDLIFEGVVGYDEITGKWYATVEPNNIRHESDEKSS